MGPPLFFLTAANKHSQPTLRSNRLHATGQRQTVYLQPTYLPGTKRAAKKSPRARHCSPFCGFARTKPACDAGDAREAQQHHDEVRGCAGYRHQGPPVQICGASPSVAAAPAATDGSAPFNVYGMDLLAVSGVALSFVVVLSRSRLEGGAGSAVVASASRREKGCLVGRTEMSLRLLAGKNGQWSQQPTSYRSAVTRVPLRGVLLHAC